MPLPKRVMIKEVSPRDGLQNEQKVLAARDKVTLVDMLSRSGLPYVEVGSFTSSKWIPALADTPEVLQEIHREPGVVYAALVPNQRGLQRALETNIDEVSVFISASETHNVRNVNQPIDGSLAIFRKVIREALSCGKTVRGYVSMVFGCPYEGQTSVESVLRITNELFELGVYEVSLGDTIGIAVPSQVQVVLEQLLRHFEANNLAMHFHDTRGTALANVFASLQLGISTFDASVGGTGGCPYAAGASGNVATEDLLYMLQNMGIDTGVSLDSLLHVSGFMQEKLGKVLPSRTLQVGVEAMNCARSSI